jgi:hypothetical protein
VHREWFWPRWGRNQDWRDKLAKRAAHKSMDIPDDEMQINTDNSRRGIGALGAIGIAAAAGLPGAIGAGLLGLGMLQGTGDRGQGAGAAAAPPAAVAPIADREYDVRFFDKDGNLIDIPPLKEREAAPSDPKGAHGG